MIEFEALQRYAREYLLAKQKYERAILTNIRSSGTIKDKVVFWQMVKDLQEIVKVELHGSQNDPVRIGIKEWIRQLCAHSKSDYSLEDIESFIRTYSKLKSDLTKNLTIPELTERFGERFHDVVDSIPLAGRDSCLRILAGEVTDGTTLNQVLGENVWVTDRDNLVEQTLEEVYVDILATHLSIAGEGSEEFLSAFEKEG